MLPPRGSGGAGGLGVLQDATKGLGNINQQLNSVSNALPSGGLDLSGFDKLSDAVNAVTDQMSGLAEMIPELGPVISAVIKALAEFTTALITAIKVVFQLVGVFLQIADKVNQFGDAVTRSGGTTAEVAALIAKGIPAGQIAGRAASLQEKLTTDPFAIAAGASAGIRALPRPHGAGDEAKNLQAAIEMLRKVGEGEKQLNLARRLGLEDLLKFVNVSKDVQAQQDAIGKTMEQVFDPATQRAARDLAAAWDLVMKAMDAIIVAFGKTAFEPIKRGLLGLAEALRKVADFFQQNPAIGAILGALLDIALNSIRMFVLNLLNIFKGLVSLFPGYADFNEQMTRYQDELNKQLARNTQSNKDLQGSIDTWRQGLFGGGPRAQGALGSGMQGEFLRQVAQGQTLRLGAFSL